MAVMVLTVSGIAFVGDDDLGGGNNHKKGGKPAVCTDTAHQGGIFTAAVNYRVPLDFYPTLAGQKRPPLARRARSYVC